MTKKPHSLFLMLLVVFIPLMMAYALTAFFNQVSSVISHSVLQDIPLSASTLGFVISIYLLAFALSQPFMGLLLDRFGPKLVLPGVLLVGAIGSLVFAHANNSYEVFLGRILLGVGCSSSTMAGFKAIRMWFPKERVPLLNGLFMGLGTIGGLASTLPVEYALHAFTWRQVMDFMTILIVLIAILVFVLVPRKAKAETVGVKAQFAGMWQIYCTPYFWRLAPLAMFAFSGCMVMVSLWAGPWLMDVAHLSHAQATERMFTLSLSLLIGIISFGLIADWFTNKLKQPITRLIGIGLFLFMCVQLLFVLDIGAGSIALWFLFGFFGRTVTLSYAAVSQYFPSEVSARASTAINALMCFMGFLMGYFIGIVLGFWTPISVGHYPVVAYQTAFGLLLAFQFISFIWFLFRR